MNGLSLTLNGVHVLWGGIFPYTHTHIYICMYVQSDVPKGQVFPCKLRHKDCSSAQRQVFHRNLRNQGCSFTRDE